MQDAQNIRPFGLWTATALVVGGMIGSGIFLMPTSLAPFGWTGVLAWVISIIGASCVAFALSRLASTMPGESGAIAIVGNVLGVLPGVLVGWSYWVSVWAANAAIAIAAASYLTVLRLTPLPGAATAIALIWLLTLINMGGARLAGQFQVVTTVLKLVPLIIVAAILFHLGFSPTQVLPPLPGGATILAGLSSAVALTLFPLVGFEAAGIAAERVRNPERNVLRATMIGTGLTGLLYIIVCSGIVLTLPAEVLGNSNAPFQLFIVTYGGAAMAGIVSAFAAIAAIGALNGWVLIQGEVPLGMARAGLLPRWFAAVSPRDVPVRVLVISSTFASLLVYANSSKSMSGVFEFAAQLTTCATLWLYAAACVAALMRRVAVVPSLIGLPFTFWAFWGAGRDASLLSIALMLSALPVYALRTWGAAPKSA